MKKKYLTLNTNLTSVFKSKMIIMLLMLNCEGFSQDTKHYGTVRLYSSSFWEVLDSDIDEKNPFEASVGVGISYAYKVLKNLRLELIF